MGQRSITFNIPAGAGDYDADVIVCRGDDKGLPDFVRELEINVVDALPAGGTIEVEQLKIGGDLNDDADWISKDSITAAGSSLLTFAGWPGVRVRAKSDGAAGDVEVHIAWLSIAES